ncbi:MAG: hypothetical protein MRZ39_01735 [Oscillospiraceae bacterium]|nr:hypothetical protein [Oscillospiraceae bacterium]
MSELNDCFKEAVCVDVQRIFDSCSDRDCIYDLPITLTQDSAPITDEMDIVRTRCAEVEVTCISVDPVPFKNGFYAVDITYRFKITAEAFTQGFCKNQAGTILCGTALWNKRVILYGSEGTSKIFTSDQDLFPTDVECNECTCCNDAASMPKATVRVLDPIALDTKLACKKPYPPHCCQPCEEEPKPCERVLTVSLGLFSIIQLSRPVSIIVPAYDYCIPCKDCSLTDTGESPCDVFDKLEFPSEQFFPQPSSDATKYGCCDKNEKKKCDCDGD